MVRRRGTHAIDRVLPQKLKGRKFGRFRHRWEDNTEINQRSRMLKFGLNSYGSG
jgi:hypothetical protein